MQKEIIDSGVLLNDQGKADPGRLGQTSEPGL